jgi:hypothetical protein
MTHVLARQPGSAATAIQFPALRTNRFALPSYISAHAECALQCKPAARTWKFDTNFRIKERAMELWQIIMNTGVN